MVVPIARRTEWDDAKEFCRLVATAIVRAAPQHYTANMSKAARHGKIYLDYLRNGRGASDPPLFDSCAATEPPLPCPSPGMTSSDSTQQINSTTRNAVERLRRQKQNPWADIAHIRQSISAAAHKKLEKLTSA